MTWTLTAAQTTAMDRALAQARSHCGEVGGTVDAGAFLDIVVRNGLESIDLAPREWHEPEADPVEDDGWIPWDGGDESPVSGVRTRYRLRDLTEHETDCPERRPWWGRAPDRDSDIIAYEIVAYRVVKESP